MEGDISLTVTATGENSKHLLATRRDGTVLFDGPIDTDEQKEKIPPEVSRLLDKLNASVDIRTETAVE